MKTTALFVELLIIGAMTCIWIVLFLMKDFNELDFANLVVFVKSNKYLVTAVAVPVVYTVGIVFDKLAKYIFQIIGSFYDRKPVGRNLKKHLCEK